ncbi:hypothetical protein ACC811_37070, partial [Rhizobium ruizarguesonis]
GTIGGICLVLGLYALALLPVSFAGLGLIILGVGLTVAEAHSPSFGALGVGGGIALVLGENIKGGPVPRNYIPAVEAGAREAM